MCNRFHQSEKAVEAAREALGAVLDVDMTIDPPRQIFPTGAKTARFGRVFARADAGNRPLEERLMEWGYPTKIKGKSGKMLDRYVTNARNLASPFWRRSLAHPEHRCLVPFSWFAEPDPEGGKGADGLPAQVWFALKGQPFGLFAGLWRQTDRGPAFAFATTEPNEVVKPIHPKAMPAILSAGDALTWLDGSADEAAALVRPWAGELRMQRKTPPLR